MLLHARPPLVEASKFDTQPTELMENSCVEIANGGGSICDHSNSSTCSLNKGFPIDIVIVRVCESHRPFFFDRFFRSKGPDIDFPPNVGRVTTGALNDPFIVDHDAASLDRKINWIVRIPTLDHQRMGLIAILGQVLRSAVADGSMGSWLGFWGDVIGGRLVPVNSERS